MVISMILGFACMTNLIVDFINEIDYKPIQRKPFTCDMCMGFWLSFMPLMFMYGLRGILLASIVGISADLIYRIRERLL